MFRKFIIYFFTLSTLLFLGCSTKKNTFLSRAYHNTTSKYNGYFNANEIVKEAVAGVENEHQDDYDHILPLFIYGDETQARSLYPPMDEAIKKCSEVIDRHSMVFRNKEYCKWIDDNYLLIGKASFYKKDFVKAIELFNYVARNYTEEPIRFEAMLWLARTHSEQKEFTKAKNNIKIATSDKDFPEKLSIEAKLISADISLKQKDYSEAVIQLEVATQLIKKRKTRARVTFILAQIYQERNDAEKAIRAYNKVISLRPGYEMEFYANINQALAFNNKVNSAGIKAKLNKMLDDSKNKEFFDQIYYALAEIELKERNREEAFRLLQLSAEANINNDKQKARTFLRMANLHFEDRAYESAQQYYDSTSILISDDHDQFELVINRKESLTQLVNNLKTISRQDSLQKIANMDEDTRNLFIDNLIQDELAAAEERIRAEELALQRINQGNNQPLTAGIQSGGWYFYNIAAMNFGKNEFSKRWGSRKLEDDWRRSNKSSTGFQNNPGDNFANNTVNAQTGSRESYLIDLPTTTAQMDSSNALIDQALYSNGILYKEKLNDITNAIESFEELTARFNHSNNLVTTYYQLYRLYLQKENSGGNNYVSFDFKSSSAYYKDKILLDYPDSEFAELLRDPNYKKTEDVEADRQQNDYAYTFELFSKKIYDEALIRSNSAINNEPDNVLLPKYYLIKAQILATIKDKDGYQKALEDLVANHGNTEEGKVAKDLLDRMEQYSPEKTSAPVAVIEAGLYILDEKSEHYFIIVFPNKDESSIGLKNNIISFNDRYYRNENIKIAESFIDNQNQLMILRSFENKRKAKAYYKTFVTNTDILSAVNKKPEFKKYLISTRNFSELFRSKNLTEYETFFDKNYMN